jgi:hypothetical protein
VEFCRTGRREPVKPYGSAANEFLSALAAGKVIRSPAKSTARALIVILILRESG